MQARARFVGRLALCAASAASIAALPALASDGVIEINQAKALAGGVTAFDGPGFPVTVTAPGSYILTSAVKRVDVGVYNAIKAAKAGKYKGGSNAVFNLKNNGVALGKISPKLKGKLRTQILARVAVLQKQIIAGKIKIPTAVS